MTVKVTRVGDDFLVWGVWGLLALGLAFIGAYGWSISAGDRLACMSALALIAVSAGAAASVAGFLFGIPRSRLGAAGETGSIGENRFDENTNLEQISDWLTKVLVGVGLTEMSEIPERFQSLAQFATAGIPGQVASTSVVGALILYFGTWGFLSSYIITRIYFRALLNRYDDGGTYTSSTVVASVVTSTPAEVDQAPRG